MKSLLAFLAFIALACGPALAADRGEQRNLAAASVIAPATQVDIQQRAAELKNLKWGMFICWSFSTFSEKEWTPGITNLSFFRATNVDTDQWARTAKEAGMGYILFLTKHHDGFCLWDTQTTDRKVTQAPLGRDVLAELRKSCDKYGIKLALYFSEGEWRHPGGRDHPDTPEPKKENQGGRDPEMKKAQLKELLTQYGPIEYIWFDHAVGEGGLSHAETLAFCKALQPGCFIGFNHGDQTGADIRLGEMGQPGPLTDNSGAGYNQDAPSKNFLLAEFTYPIQPKRPKGAMWFYSHPDNEGVCSSAESLYRDYLGAVKFENIFSIDVGPDYEGKLRDIDVKTLREVGGMIRAGVEPSPQIEPKKISAAAKPNIVLIFTDDQGYGDLGSFGSKTIRTPNLDRLAKEGRRFTSFMVASSICSPSRSALLTGSYPKRVGMHKGVLFPGSTTGLNPAEHTIADHLKQQGYATAAFGKWHLGHHPEVLPTAQGFDKYFGIPYSNDMNHPDNEGKPEGGVAGMDALWKDPESTLTKWNTPLMENEKIVELPVDQRTITRRCTDRGIAFIKENQKRPFFLYLPYSMPHIPLYVPDDVRDPDPKRAYINTIEHLDAEVGRIFDLLRELKLAENTYVIFATDNGPWLSFKHHAGSAGPLRKGKFSTFEGGFRVPCIMWAPGRIPAGTECDALASTIDLLPTIAALTGTKLPADRTIDGMDITALLSGTAKSVRTEFLYYNANGNLEGIREGDWKLLEIKPDAKRSNEATSELGVMLFNLVEDIGAKRNLAAEQPELVERLRKRMVELDKAIEAGARPVWKKSGT